MASSTFASLSIIFANNFDLLSIGFGMIGSSFSGKQKDLYNYNYYHYYPRPNYHVYKMYSDHFGDNFIGIDVKCETYDGEKYLQLNQNHHKAYYLLGEIYNREGEQGDIGRSISYYQKSISINSFYPDPYRELGLVYYKQEKKALARKYFEEYLNLSTEAQDIEYIKLYLQQI